MWQAGDHSHCEIHWLIIHCAHSAVKAPLSKPVLFKPASAGLSATGVNRHLVAEGRFPAVTNQTQTTTSGPLQPPSPV